jgi:hypothetical protein
MNDTRVHISTPSITRRNAWLSVLVWLLAMLPIIQIIHLPENHQWDFRVYYSAAMTFDQGYDPYDANQRAKVFPAPGMEFFYPPVILYLFQPLTALQFGTAYLLWFGLKLLALMLLLLIWHRTFEPLNPRYPMVLFFLLAYSSTLYLDLVAGNITIFEQLVLWLGFCSLLRRRYFLFGFCIALVAQFKLQPIIFLGLLFVAEARPRWLELGISLASFLALFSLNFLLQPVLMQSFIARISAGGGNLGELGHINPSMLAFIRDGIIILSKSIHQLPPYVDILFYIIAVLGVLTLCLYSFRIHRKKNPETDLKSLIYIASLVFCVIVPRMKDYGYVLCLIPTLSILRRQKNKLVPIWAVFVLAPSTSSYIPFPFFENLSVLSSYFYSYLPLLSAGMMLWLYLDEFRKPSVMQTSHIK